MEKRKAIVKEYSGKVKLPDILEWDEAKRFVSLPEKAKSKMLENDPVEWQRLVDLVDKVNAEWQSWFMDQDKDAEHPFRRGIFVKRWKPEFDMKYLMGG